MTVMPLRLDRRVALLALVAIGVGVLLLFAPDVLAQGTSTTSSGGADVGKNFGDLLQKYAGEIYVGIIAIVGLIFLINKAYAQLGMFLIAAVVVGMLVVAPEDFKNLAKSTADSLFK